MDEAGNLLRGGQTGEIVIRGANVMGGYKNNSDANTAAYHDGWFRTGDQGYLDCDGYLFITGRIKDLIIRGGENISTGEIEDVLEAHPKVAEAAVIGAPDAEWGEVVKAIIVPAESDKPTLEELVEHTKSQLASYKAPSYIAIVDELPRNPLGKVLKTELRKQYGEPKNG